MTDHVTDLGHPPVCGPGGYRPTVIRPCRKDFVQFVLDDVAARRQAEDDFYAGLNPNTGEVA